MNYLGNLIFGFLFAIGFFLAQVLVTAVFHARICGG
jgi:hypothetical protein